MTAITAAQATAPLPAGTLEKLANASTATIATQLFGLGLRNTFLAGLQALTSTGTTLVGEAFTLRCIPAREDIDVLTAFDDYDHPQRRAVESVGPGQVLVVDSRGHGRAASAGEILLTRLMKRGAAGFVTDGTLRDVSGISQLSMPVYATGASAMTNLAQHHAVDMQVPIACAEVAVYPGDIIVGDADGVVCIPRHLAAQVAGPAAEQERLESYLLGVIAGGRPLVNVYPPNGDTRADYARHIAQGA